MSDEAEAHFTTCPFHDAETRVAAYTTSCITHEHSFDTLAESLTEITEWLWAYLLPWSEPGTALKGPRDSEAVIQKNRPLGHPKGRGFNWFYLLHDRGGYAVLFWELESRVFLITWLQ